jgi:aminocarboxymuconate-semialdehyde decarboxylase
LNIDIHNHFFPKAYLEELKKEKGYASVGTDSEGRMLIYYRGDYNIVVGPHVDLDKRLEAMDKYDVDMQVLTLTTPGVEREEPDRGIRLARATNDAFSEIVTKYPERFAALATLPMQEPKAAVEELERAIEELGLRGAAIFSNINNKPLDSKEFWPIYEKASKMDIPLFIHPTTPIDDKAMEDYRLVPIIGFGLDTSLAVLRLIFSGVFEKYPSLKIIAAHLGGVVPYLTGRIDTCYQAYPECKVNIDKVPSEYLKHIWIDSICYNKEVFMCAYALLGPERILLGSDFPHQISDIEGAVRRIRDLNIPEDAKRKILGENALKLLRL